MRSTASCALSTPTTRTTTAAPAPWSPQANGTLMARGTIDWLRAGIPATGIIALSCGDGVERVTRIELALSAWEADVLPLNYTRERRAGAAADDAAHRRNLPRHRTGCRRRLRMPRTSVVRPADGAPLQAQARQGPIPARKR